MSESAFAPALRAVRHSARPLLLIQASAILLVLVYDLDPRFRINANHLEEVKVQGGLLFASLATGFAGAILPQGARAMTKRPTVPLGSLAFQFVFFAFLGVTVDLLYRYLALLFGSVPSVEVVGKKLLVDQFVYSPCISIPLSSLAFMWEANRFSFRETSEDFRRGRLKQRYLALLVTCWCFWVPVLACVYSLPSNLQFMLFLCANGAWSLLLVFISAE